MAYGSEIYVDPSIAANTGSGTIGDPYGDVEYALSLQASIPAGGLRVNVKAGTAEVLVAQMAASFTPNPAEGNQLTIEGYTSAAGDGGMAQISGGGSVGCWVDVTKDYINFKNLELYNCGANNIVQTDNYCSIVSCILHGSTSGGANLQVGGRIVNSYFYDIGAVGVTLNGANCYAMFNYVKSKSSMTSQMTRGITLGTNTYCEFNIVDVDGNTIGILGGNDTRIDHNSVYGDGSGTGAGISVPATAVQQSVRNNVVEGFAGTGGSGISWSTTTGVTYYSGNACYNNTTDYDGSPSMFAIEEGDNETLSASPFTDAANGDFTPVDTGNIVDGGLPQIVGGGLV